MLQFIILLEAFYKRRNTQSEVHTSIHLCMELCRYCTNKVKWTFLPSEMCKCYRHKDYKQA